MSEPPLPTPREMAWHVFRIMIFLAALVPIYWVTHTSEPWPKRLAVLVIVEAALLAFWYLAGSVLKGSD